MDNHGRQAGVSLCMGNINNVYEHDVVLLRIDC